VAALELAAGAARARIVAPDVREVVVHPRARAGLHVRPAVHGRALVLQPLRPALAEPGRDRRTLTAVRCTPTAARRTLTAARRTLTAARRTLTAARRSLAAGGRVLSTGLAAGPPGVGAATGPAVSPG
jgi:hypothetical protein